MIALVTLAVLVGLIVLIGVNELLFGGSLFDSQTVGAIGGLGVLAAVIGAGAMRRHRGQGGAALRNAAIWLAILTALVFGYWLYGRP